MNELIASVLVLLMAAAVLRFGIAHFAAFERRLVWAGFWAHVLASFAQVGITRYYYGGGDMFLYYDTGRRLADLMRLQFSLFAPRVAELVVGGTPVLPMDVIGLGGTTGAMSGIAAFMLLVLADSLLAVCLLFGLFALAGQVCIYKVMRDSFPAVFRRRVLWAVFLVPSVVFWSSSILKEALALGALGWLVLGASRLLVKLFDLRGIGYTLFGLGVMMVVKPYILFPLTIAGGVWVYWRRKGVGLRPADLYRRLVYAVAAVLAMLGGLYVLGETFPAYSVANFADNIEYSQGLYARTQAGSTFAYVSEEPIEGVRQIYFAPWALVSALLRPFIFEVHNITSLVNALETLVLLVLLGLVIFRTPLRVTVKQVLGSPSMMFALTFVLVLGVSVGLAAPNLGSLSRYRIPLMPFWVMAILLLLPINAPSTPRPPAPRPL